MKIEVGNKFWCIAPSIESEKYSSEFSAPPVFPREIIISGIHNGNIVGHQFSGEEVDTDSNATVCVKETDLYESFFKAKEAFHKQAFDRIEEIQYYLKKYTEEINSIE